MPRWRKSKDQSSPALQDDPYLVALDAARESIDELSAATPGSDRERWAALSGTMDDDPLVLRIKWLGRDDEGWEHAARAISGTPTEVLKTQARSYQHNFVQRWGQEISALSRQDPLCEGLMRIGFDCWIVGYAESGADWTIGVPWWHIQMDLLADAAAERLEMF
jgi:hypothetical protein